MKTVCSVLVLCAALVVNSPAEASTIELSGGTAGTIPGGSINDFIPTLFAGPEIGGYYGSTILLDASSTLVIDFFGAEALFINSFELAGSTLFTNSGGTTIAPDLSSPFASFSTATLAAGLLPFRFIVDGGAGSVANGSNPDDSGGAATGPNFFATCNPFGTVPGAGRTTCRTVYLFLDDGGAGPDDNHDDFLVRISAVPEPATVGMLALGLLGLARRRFRH
jgi:hypothetical protein